MTGHALHAPVHVVGVLSAFGLGLLGSAHCIAMCGGFAAAIAQGPPKASARTARMLVCFGGRIGAYVLLGAAFGALGAVLGGAESAAWGRSTGVWVRTALGGAMIGLGIALAAEGRALRALERGGAALWHHVAPLTRRLRPLDRTWKLAALGALWGFLPCGLVYAALAGAAAAGTPVTGALWMGAFGLGTVPALAGLTTVSSWLARIARTRRTAGVVLSLYGIWTIVGSLAFV